MRHSALILAAVLALAACASDGPSAADAARSAEAVDAVSGGKALPPLRRPPGLDMAPDKRAACEAGGGKVLRRGMAQAEICVHAYSDGGKSCTDSAQCEGMCIGKPGPENMDTTGTCQREDKTFGCFAEIVNARPVRPMCRD